jgi:hypothetical protein
MTKGLPFQGDCRATQELFGPVAGSGLNVSLDTFGHGFLVYADGYKRAGDTVVQNLLGSDKQVLVFPVCYLYRHYLELMIKGLTLLANVILSKEAVYSTHHKLMDLWAVCRPMLEKAMPQCSSEGFSSVGKCVEGFASFDFEGEFFRYPENRSRGPWQQSVERINLQGMRDAVSNAAELLDSYYLEMNSILEHRAETAEP